MQSIFIKLRQTFFHNILESVGRYGLGVAALIILIETIWASSVLLPVLFVIGILFEFTNAWLAILPGILGAVTFLIILTIGGFAAALPSTYVARWRECMIDKIKALYPDPSLQLSKINSATNLGNGLEIQDAD